MTSTDILGSLTPSHSLSAKSMLLDRKFATFLDPLLLCTDVIYGSPYGKMSVLYVCML